MVKETKNDSQVFLKSGPCGLILKTCFKPCLGKKVVPPKSGQTSPNVCPLSSGLPEPSCRSVLVVDVSGELGSLEPWSGCVLSLCCLLLQLLQCFERSGLMSCKGRRFRQISRICFNSLKS